MEAAEGAAESVPVVPEPMTVEALVVLPECAPEAAEPPVKPEPAAEAPPVVEALAVTAVPVDDNDEVVQPDKKRSRRSGGKVPRWNEAEEALLRTAVAELGEKKWDECAGRLGTGRSGAGVEQHWQIMMGKRKRNGKPDHCDCTVTVLVGIEFPADAEVIIAHERAQPAKAARQEAREEKARAKDEKRRAKVEAREEKAMAKEEKQAAKAAKAAAKEQRQKLPKSAWRPAPAHPPQSRRAPARAAPVSQRARSPPPPDRAAVGVHHVLQAHAPAHPQRQPRDEADRGGQAPGCCVETAVR